jgi:hypothetical protein
VNTLTITKNMNLKLIRIRLIFGALVLIAAIGGLSSCEKVSYAPPAVDPNATWHFQTDIQPIFTANCIACHNGTRLPDLRSGKSYLSLTKGGFVNSPASTSRLYVRITTGDHIPRTTDVDKQKILFWITQGAKNN